MSEPQKCSARKKLLSGSLIRTIPLVFFILQSVVSPLKAQFQPLGDLDLKKPLNFCWKYQTPGFQQIASDNHLSSYTFSSAGKLISLNPNSGLTDWETNIGGINSNRPLNDKNNIFLISQIQTVDPQKSTATVVNQKTVYVVRSVSSLTGITKWQTNLPLPEFQGELYFRLFENTLIIVSSKGTLISIKSDDGTINRKRFLQSDLTAPPYFADKKLFLGVAGSQIKILPIESFSIIGEIDTFAVTTVISKTENLLLWGDRRGVVTAADNRSFSFPRVKWKTRGGGEITSITGTLQGILIASSDNYLYMVSAENGNLIWKKRLANRVAFPPYVSRDYLIALTLGEAVGVIVELKTGKTVNRVVLPEGIFFIGEPQVLDGMILFSTSEGIAAYSTRRCLAGK